MTQLDHIDRLILNSIQEDFPVESRPYQALAERINQAHRLSLTGDDVLGRVTNLKKNGYIRRLGAVFNARELGYNSTLCAARVPQDKVETFAARVNQAPQVTHNYLRSDELNVWFTFTSETQEELFNFLGKLKQETGVEEIHILESEKLFKIKVGFQLRDK